MCTHLELLEGDSAGVVHIYLFEDITQLVKLCRRRRERNRLPQLAHRQTQSHIGNQANAHRTMAHGSVTSIPPVPRPPLAGAYAPC